MSRRPRMGNLFSGSGAWELAAQICGMDVVFEAEIEKFPIELEAKRFPEAIQLGDVSKINGADLPPVDILTNSSPCQGLSIAGKRGGLQNDERSGLFHEAIRITKEMMAEDDKRWADDNIRLSETPRLRYWCWENVPGAFSSNKGEDFRKVLESVAGLVEENPHIPMPPKGWSYAGVVDGEGWEIAWRTMDAQFYGVPQRRRRVFLVASLRGGVQPKFSLSERACLGILRRSQKRGKILPEVLENALVKQAGLSWEMYEQKKLEWKS